MESEETAKIRKIIDDLAALIRSLPVTVEALNDELARCEAAIMDIDHWLEINDFPARVGGKLSKQIKELRLKRRDIKDNLMILAPIHEYLLANASAFKHLDKVRGEVRKKVTYVKGERSYTPRVLHDLFGKEFPQGSIAAAMKKAEG